MDFFYKFIFYENNIIIWCYRWKSISVKQFSWVVPPKEPLRLLYRTLEQTKEFFFFLEVPVEKILKALGRTSLGI